MSDESKLPRALSALLADLKIPDSHVLDVVAEATPRTPWIVSVDRELTRKPHPYAVVRPKGLTYFDSYQDAINEAGGAAAATATGDYFELLEVTSRLDAQGNPLEIPIRPPATFRGQVGNMLLFTAPMYLLLAPGQTKALHNAANVALCDAIASGALPKSTDIQMMMIPEGMRLVRLVESKSS